MVGPEPDDVGDVMAAVLLDERHTEQTYSLSGPRTLTMTEVADELTTATGRQVRYAGLSVEQIATDSAGTAGSPRPRRWPTAWPTR